MPMSNFLLEPIYADSLKDDREKWAFFYPKQDNYSNVMSTMHAFGSAADNVWGYVGESGYDINFVHNLQTGKEKPYWVYGGCYIMAGDEPLSSSDQPITNFMSADALDGIKKVFLQIPRQLIRKWILDNIYPTMPHGFVNVALGRQILQGGRIIPMIAKSVADIEAGYNVVYVQYDPWPTIFRGLWDYYGNVNNDFCDANNITAWTWEFAKYKGWRNAYPDQDIPTVYGLDITHIEWQLKNTVINEYVKNLDPIADFNLEYNRELCIVKLIEKGEFLAAIGLIRSFNKIDPSYAEVLAKELDPDNNVLTLKESKPMIIGDHPITSIITEYTQAPTA